MRLTRIQSDVMLDALKASGVTLAHLCRKHNLPYALFRKWLHGETPADKHNLWYKFRDVVNAELGVSCETNTSV